MASIGHLESPDTSTKVTLIDSPSIRRCSPGARVNSLSRGAAGAVGALSQPVIRRRQNRSLNVRMACGRAIAVPD